jgi:hypothetical protein
MCNEASFASQLFCEPVSRASLEHRRVTYIYAIHILQPYRVIVYAILVLEAVLRVLYSRHNEQATGHEVHDQQQH